MKTGCIYVLKDPITDQIRYIGQTIVKPQNRYNQHIYQWKRCGSKINKVNSWIKSLFNFNLKPVLEILEDSISENELDQKEIFYILKYKEMTDLCNHTDGGKGTRGFVQTKESKEKRLNSLKTSESWKVRNKRHSEIMKEYYKENKLNLGCKHLSKERIEQMNQQRREKMNNLYANGFIPGNARRVRVFTEDLSFSKDFNTLEDAARFLGLKCSKTITMTCNGLQKFTAKRYKAIFI